MEREKFSQVFVKSSIDNDRQEERNYFPKGPRKRDPLAPKGKLVDSREQTTTKKEGQNYSTV